MPTIEKCIPIEQAGFRRNRNFCDKVLAITTLIENGFHCYNKTGTVFIDLSSAYDTVWCHGLLTKLVRVVPYKTINMFITNMLSSRQISLYHEERESKIRNINIGEDLKF